MNPGLAMFKNAQRFQGGSRDVVDPIAWLQEEREKPGGLTPEDLARFHAEQQQMNEQNRKRAMNEVQQYTKGTGNVGLNLFRRKQMLAKGSSGIHIDPANKGKFTALQKRTGQTTEELKHSPNPLTRKRAVFAQMAKRHFKPL